MADKESVEYQLVKVLWDSDKEYITIDGQVLKLRQPQILKIPKADARELIAHGMVESAEPADIARRQANKAPKLILPPDAQERKKKEKSRAVIEEL